MSVSKIFSQEYIYQTLKEQNLKFSFPKDWRWQIFSPIREDKKIFEGFNQGKKIIYQIYFEPVKASGLKQTKKFIKKLKLSQDLEPTPVEIDFPNLKNLNAQAFLYEIYLPKPMIGYFITASDGIWQYYFRIEVSKEEEENYQEIISKLLSSIETIFEWKQICCSICMREIRYSKRMSTSCTDYITENPCYQYLKNKKMNYEKCK